jgi:acyl transferase domain-containing protein/acyl carrier protein
VATAYQALLDFQCDMAIAGGVGLNIPQERGYSYYKEGGLSQDAACHFFDKDATGVMHGNGLGVVILKRLEDALEDEDNVIAVIKGATMNNDGSKKVAYFTPSVDGQMEAINETLSVTDIDPENIHYIEAHGPGTPVGDPIEFRALTQAYEVDTSKQYKNICALGSIKSHVGHLGAASGVAGLIHASLILKNRQIPATMHFKEINPEIDIENSPFYINTQLKHLDDSYPETLNAAISSFGIGGTNVHVMIQSAPNVQKEHKSWQSNQYLFPLSAKSEKALQLQTQQLSQYLLANTQEALSDISYTLQQRRAHFSNRRFIVAKNHEELQAQLNAVKVPKGQTHTTTDKNKVDAFVFMFPGVGDQYINMGRDLYEQQNVFKGIIDECAQLSMQNLDGLDIRTVLYPNKDALEAAQALMGKAEVTLTILLSVEYALAKQLEYFGVVPNQMIGHSLGEYCAALVSGVFTLEQALSLVAYRGKLIQSCESGAMLVVNAETSKLEEILPAQLSLAVVNAPQLNMISGPVVDIEAFEVVLKQNNISYTRLPGDRAGHSSTLDPILDEFESFIEAMDLNVPQIPFISNVTGDWISDEEATSAFYWRKHLRQTVQFHKGLTKLIQQENTAFIEIGAGRGLSTIAKRHPSASRALKAYASMKSANKKTDDNVILYELLGALWLDQYALNWDSLASKEQCHLVNLPTYAFDRQSYWLDRNTNVSKTQSAPAQKREDMNSWFYTPSWVRLGLNDQKQSEINNYVVFNPQNHIADNLIAHLESTGKVICVNYAKQYQKVDEENYLMNPLNNEDYDALLKSVKEYSDELFCIIHAWMLTQFDSEEALFYESSSQTLGYFSLAALMRSLTKHNLLNSRLAVLSSEIFNVTGKENIDANKATILGPCKVIPYEFPEMDFIHVDVDLISLHENSKFESLLNDITSYAPKDKYLSIAYRNANRWKPYYQAIESTVIEQDNVQNMKVENGGTYLITGAFGGIGSVASKWLVQQAKEIHLVLISRTPLPLKNQWESMLENQDNPKMCERIKQVQALEKQGAKVTTFAMDISDKHAVEQLQNDIGSVNGIIHAAGVVGGGLIELEESIEFHHNLDTKVIGTKLLYSHFANEDLDFMILCSSLGSLVGALGQVENTSANSFLDAFAQQINQTSTTKIMAVNWDYWLEVGMILELADRHKQIAGDEISVGILPTEGEKCFSILLNLLSMPNVVVSSADIHELLKSRSTVTQKALQMFENADITKQNNDAREMLSTDYVAPRSNIEKVLVALWQNRLGIKIGINDNFFELGGDSMIALPLMADMRDTLHFDLPIQSLFNEQDVASIAQFITDNEPSSGTTEQIAEVFLQVQNLSHDEVNQALEQ